MYRIGSHDKRPRLGSIRLVAVGLAALFLVTGCSVAGASPSQTTGSSVFVSPTTLGSASPSATSPSPEPSVPTPGPSAASFTTAGVTSNWTGLSWTQLPSDHPLLKADFGVQLLAWQHGYVLYGTTGGGEKGIVWTSPDGQTWTQVTAIAAPKVLVAASPAGLVAVAGDPYAAVPSETVWTSSDGVAWRNAGPPSGVAFVDSIAGTAAGLVATAHTLNGSGKFATQTFSVAFSTDGIRWTPVEVQPGITWDYVGPQIQSGNNRFFVMGGYTDSLTSNSEFRLDALDVTAGLGGRGLVGSGAQGTGGVWWSDDGRTWTRSTPRVINFPVGLLFGKSGMLLYTSERAIPGGYGLDLSTDGGKTWQTDASFEPVGAIVCGQGECSTGPDGAFASNGTVLVAIKGNGKTWISYDARNWIPIAGNGPADNSGSFLVLPRSVIVGSAYGAAK